MKWPWSKPPRQEQALPDLNAIAEVMARIEELHVAIDAVKTEIQDVEALAGRCAIPLLEAKSIREAALQAAVDARREREWPSLFFMAHAWSWSTYKAKGGDLVGGMYQRLFRSVQGVTGQGYAHALSPSEVEDGRKPVPSSMQWALSGVVVGVFADAEAIPHVQRHCVVDLQKGDHVAYQLPPLDAWSYLSAPGGYVFRMPINAPPGEVDGAGIRWGFRMPLLEQDMEIRVALAWRQVELPPEGLPTLPTLPWEQA